MAKQRGSSQMSGVHLLAPGRPYAPVGFNPLENVPPDERWKVTADIVSLFSDIWKLGPETPRLLLSQGVNPAFTRQSEHHASGYKTSACR
jgi:hypothetical protein